MSRATHLRAVDPTPSTEDLLRQTIHQRDVAVKMVEKLDRLIVELGQSLWHEQNPGQKRFMKVRAEEARRMVGL